MSHFWLAAWLLDLVLLSGLATGALCVKDRHLPRWFQELAPVRGRWLRYLIAGTLLVTILGGVSVIPVLLRG